MGTEIDSRVVGSTPLEKQVAATGNWDPGMAGRYQGHGAFQSDEPSVHFALVSVFVRCKLSLPPRPQAYRTEKSP